MPAHFSVNYEKIQNIIKTIQKESDRACAILVSATLDALLEALLRRAMLPNPPRELFEGHAALSSFSAKIDVAHSLGLIGELERGDLHIIRKIRNEFAHAVDHELSFSTGSVVDRVRGLRIPQMFKNHPILSRESDNPRWRFEICSGFMVVSLKDFRMSSARPPDTPTELSVRPR